MTTNIAATLAQTHPYDLLSPDERDALAGQVGTRSVAAGDVVYALGEPVTHLCLILSGRVEITDEAGELLSILGPRNSFGERGLLRDGIAPVTATRPRRASC